MCGSGSGLFFFRILEGFLDGESFLNAQGCLGDPSRILRGFLEDSLTGDAHCLIRGCGSLFEWQRFLEDSSDIGRDHVETGEDSFRIPGVS